MTTRKINERDYARFQVDQWFKSFDRPGAYALMNYMDQNGFFTSPASSKYHLNMPGGLLIHSRNVTIQFLNFVNSSRVKIPETSIYICGILHDICKMDLYIKTDDGYVFNKEHSKRKHGSYSVELIQKFMTLTSIEEIIIKYHMGYYGTNEFSWNGDYSIKDLCQVNGDHNVTKLFHWADDFATQFRDPLYDKQEAEDE